MKIYWAFSTFAIGGPQRRFATLARALDADFTHVVTAMDGDYEACALIDRAANIRRREIDVVKSGSISPKNVARFAAALREERPDILVTSNWGAMEWRLANRRARAPHLHMEDGFGPDETFGRRSRKRDLTRRLLFSRAATGHDAYAFAAPSRGLARIFESAWGAPRERVHRIANGVALDAFLRAPRARTDRVTVGAVGALRREKRIDRLIEAFADAKGVDQLLIVGDGPERGALEALSEARGVRGRARFTGAQADVAELLAQVDIFALSSDTEQMPIALIEAMAAGLPIVATAVGDIAEMTAPENRAYLVKLSDDEATRRALSAQMTALASDPAGRQSLGALNRARARERFSDAAMAARYREIFADLANISRC